MTTWYTNATPGCGGQVAYTVRPDLWPPGVWVRVWPTADPAARHLGQARVPVRPAMYANRVILTTMETHCRAAKSLGGPGVAEALVLAGLTDLDPYCADPGPWEPWP